MTKNRFPAPVRLPDTLPIRVVHQDELSDGETLRCFESEGLSAANLVRDQIKADQVSLNHASLVGSRFSRARFWDVRLRACDFANALWLDGDWTRVEVDECRLTGFQTGDSHFEHVMFRACKLDLSNFRLTTFTSCLFNRCNLKNADFQGCKMTAVRFEDCDLSGARFDRSELRDVDLRSSNVAELASVEGLSGATIDPGQAVELAPQLAGAMGLSVKYPTSE